MGGLLFDKAADEIDLLREAYRAAVRRPATELMVVGPGWHERFPVTTTPIVIDGLLQVHVSDRRDDMAAELARLRAENEQLRAEVATTDEEWRRLDVEVSHFAKLAEDRAAEVESLKAVADDAISIMESLNVFLPDHFETKQVVTETIATLRAAMAQGKV